MKTGDGTKPGEGWFFDQPHSPGDVERLTTGVAAWLGSAELRWLVENAPGRRQPLGQVERLGWPAGPHAEPAGSGRARLAAALELLGGICDWSQPGTAWDFRPAGGERRLGAAEPGVATATAEPLDAEAAGPVDAAATLPAEEVGARAAALGLRSTGRLRGGSRTFVVLGGRRAAPLNRARAAAAAIRALTPVGTEASAAAAAKVAFLCTNRPLDPAERNSPEVAAYAAAATTEVDLMHAAARILDAHLRDDSSPTGFLDAEIELVEAPSDERGRASTYDTLLALATELPADAGPVALVTSPTCRPFQYLDAVRALDLGAGFGCEAIAHPPAWAANPGTAFSRPHVYLQEIRSAIQAAGRLARELAGQVGAAEASGEVAPPLAP